MTGFVRITSLSGSAVKTIKNVSILNDVYDYNMAVDVGIFNLLYISDINLTNYVLQTIKEHAEKFQEHLNEYLNFQDQFSDVFTPGERQDIANLLEMYTETYIPVLDEIFDLVEQGRKDEALSIYINRFTPIFDTFIYYINVGFTKNLYYSLSETDKNNKSALLSAYLMMGVSLLSLIVSVMLALAVTKSISVPLSGLEIAAEKVANGELDVQFEISDSNDEIARLSQRLDGTIQQLNQTQQLKLETIEARHEKEKAEEANRTKSNFLANMSHEIRTPMNAITGMTELLLRGELSDEARSYVKDIKQAGTNLIYIINDILDFSKIEAGKLEIISVRYMLSSLLNDTVNIIRTRLVEKPLRFFTNIDANIPNVLTGDEIRLRQILLNILSNAVKYTEKGHIGLSITLEKREGQQVWLRMTVTDTGYGIKPEDREKLFGDFVQLDTKKNRSVEGTGLGLAISKRLCAAMGGDISVESEYGKGSTFTLIIPQKIESEEPFAVVEEPEKKKVLIYEIRSVYAKSICWSLENMKVPHALVTNNDDLAKALSTEEWLYVFSGYGLYDKVKKIIEKENYTNKKKPSLALMIEWGTEAYIPNARFVSLPVQSLSIANILNGVADDKVYAENSLLSGISRFTLKQARLLVVDDIATNLKVVEGLLAPYKPVVDTCLSGKEALELIKQRNYDIVFMDHMMPEMDGIETTAAIRALEGERFKNMIIIALTANAVSGMREMFIKNDFNDFLAKPIDISKLDKILDHWIPKEKKESRGVIGKIDEAENNSKTPNNPKEPIPVIPGIDVKRGIAMTGGKITSYFQVLEIFSKDAQQRLPMLKNIPNKDTLPVFVTQTHALKSASSSIGAAEVSGLALELETAGKREDFAFIQENLNKFTEQLTELVKEIESVLKDSNIATHNETSEMESLIPLLHELMGALQSGNAEEIDRIMDNLMQKIPAVDAKTKEILEKISEHILMTEFDSAMKVIRSTLESGKTK